MCTSFKTTADEWVNDDKRVNGSKLMEKQLALGYQHLNQIFF